MTSTVDVSKEAPKLRHVAILVPDPEASAVFFESAFGMRRVGNARRGIYVSDGVMNVALLRVNPEKGEKVGVFHFGMWVDDLDAADAQVKAAGATYLTGKPESPNSYYEAKYRDPNGIVFDMTHTGWAGAVKEPGTSAVENGTVLSAHN
ncbi:MAG: VOC family protein [Actinobacteria bacterium]|nr:VOC family protein [Actinomycetota bacterium]NBY72503.1 VOC family protein [Betaproteobacteria bacterium]